MKRDVAEELSSQLEPGESLVWSGRPRGGIRLSGADIFAIPFSLVWCGFVVFWLMAVIGRGAPPFFLLWGCMFLAFGLYFVFGRFLADAARRGHTCYGLTQRRAVIVSGVFGRHSQSIDLRSLANISYTQRPDRSGTISLGAPSGLRATMATAMMPPSWPGVGRYRPPSFEMIDGVYQVYSRIADLRERGG